MCVCVRVCVCVWTGGGGGGGEGMKGYEETSLNPVSDFVRLCVLCFQRQPSKYCFKSLHFTVIAKFLVRLYGIAG